MNKYFVNKGYTVFDIQYWLNNKNDNFNWARDNSNRYGNFTIDDMVRHIGIFLSYIEKHKNEYEANLDSVFISGVSAGGHLFIYYMERFMEQFK